MRQITQRICDEALVDSVPTLKLIPDWFVRTRMIKELFTALCADENLLHFNEDSGYAAFSCNKIGRS